MKLKLLMITLTTLSSAVAGQDEAKPIYNAPVGIGPDSNRVYFQSWAPDGGDGGYRSQLFSVTKDGDDLRREARIGYNEGWPSFSRDGMRVIFHTRVAGDAELVLADLRNPGNMTDFLGVRRLTVGTDSDYFAALSPDEKEVAFYSWRTDKAEIYKLDLQNGDVQPLTENGTHNSDPSWSVRGEITYESHLDGNPDVWVMLGDGSGKKNLTNHPANDHWGAWSPDGLQIVFSSDRDGSEDLYIMNRDGSDVRQLTNSPQTDHWPRWSADGSFITFERRTDAGSDAFLIAPDGNGEKRLTNGTSYHE